jgi:hypothetical protein
MDWLRIGDFLMAHFAEIDENNLVLRVLVLDNSLEADGADFLANTLGLGGTWLQTSYNGNIRKNYAGVGYTYDPERDAFISPKPETAIGFDEETCQWIVPEVIDEVQTI